MMRNENLLQVAEALKPQLIVTEKEVPGISRALSKGGETMLDFGDHYVGYLTLHLSSDGRHQDAPVLLELSFFESPEEFGEKPEKYKGWIAGSWIQREQVHIDVLPCACRLPRRYAFRYVKIRVQDCSRGFFVRVDKLSAEAVSSADDTKLLPFRGRAEDRRLDAVAVRTLHECMQEVFEDGPKRDRRLWLGDLRLQALANYETYRDYDPVKRCLCLFAGDTLEGGRVSNNLFLTPRPEVDEQFMFDYSLLFINTLLDYYRASGDEETLRELEPTAYRQYELSRAVFDRRHVVDLKRLGNCFVDWNKKLDKQTSAQAIYIYALRALVGIEQALGKNTDELEAEIGQKSEAARKHLFSEKKGLFVSGPLRQVSYASQVWMVLAGVADAEVLTRVEQHPRAVRMKTPYMFHHFIQALIDCGEKQKAYEKMTAYWGGMLNKGADTFWELYDPEDTNASPYGGKIIHSYCHAWSCTPAYFLRKYFSEEA